MLAVVCSDLEEMLTSLGSFPPPPALALPRQPPFVIALQERKYFDSGDYALSKAGKASESNVTVGTAIPKPDK